MTTLTAATPSSGKALTSSRLVPAAASSQAGLSGADLVRIIRHRLVFIIILWIVSLGITTGFTALMIKYYPSYVAESYIWVESINPVNVLNPLERVTIREDEIERTLSDQALMVESPAVLLEALKDAELRATSWWSEAEREQVEENEDPMELLEEMIRAAPVRESNYLRVSASWRVANEVAILVNTVVEKYESRVEELQKNDIRTNEEQLTSELNRAMKQFDAKRQEIETLQATEEVLMNAADGGPSERLLTLMALVTELEIEMLGRKTQWEALQNATPEQLPITPDLMTILDHDPIILEQSRRLQTAEDALGMARERFGENHRVVRESLVVRDSIADRLAEERAVKIVRYQSDQISQARRGFLEAQQQLLELKESLYAAQAEQRDRDKQYARYLRLLEEQDLLKTQLENLQEQKNTMSVMLRHEKTVQIKVRSQAIEPSQRSSPQWYIWLPVGGMIGLMLSVGLALLLELADKSVRTPRDVQDLAVLGLIPTSDDDEIEIVRVETACVDAPHSIVAEAFRNLRASLFFSAPAEQQGVILVTSPSGGNGKTTIASNLGISVALSGRRVLLIDANFRRSRLPRLFPDLKAEGLSNLLIGQGRLADLATSTFVPGLDVLSSGPIPPNPAELLGGSYLRDVIVEARSQYDQIIFDGPPVLLVSDAMVLAGAVDGVLLVCQYRETSRGALQRTRIQLEAINARVFGAVLNLVESRAGGYFRKAYREFYEYQEPEEEEGVPTRPRLDVRATAGAGAMDATPSGTASETGQMPVARAGGVGTDETTPPGGGSAEGSEGSVAMASDAVSPQKPAVALESDSAGEHKIDGLVFDESVDLDGELGLDDSPELEGLDSALPELDREIAKLTEDGAGDSGLDIEGEFKLEDLDFDGDLGESVPEDPGVDRPEE
ncbi:MAG: polysaccharide biosynthesis tyrosine autokinase [Planctomycetota bacterium]